MQSSLTCQFEHSGKVRSGLIGNFYFHCYQVRPHFLCAALTSPQRTKQFCPQIEYVLYVYFYLNSQVHTGYKPNYMEANVIMRLIKKKGGGRRRMVAKQQGGQFRSKINNCTVPETEGTCQKKKR